MSILQTGLVPSTGGYQIERSLRFNSADSAELNRTFGTPTNNKIFTISAWVKATNPSTTLLDFSLLAVGDAGIIGIAGVGAFGATYNNKIFIRNGGVTGDYWLPVFRDVSAWYHFVIAIDTTQATQADRAKLWVNGVSQAANKGASTLALNASMSINAASTTHYIGGRGAASYYANGYLTEYNFIDGQALTPSDFGETDSTTGVWKPKKYAGTYGTNGFYLNFSDNSGTTSTTLGKDSSGNGNNWTPNNFSIGLVSSKVLAITQATFAGSTTLSTTIIGSGTVNLTGFGGCGNISGSIFTGLSSITGLLNNWQTHTVYKNGVSLFTITGGSVYNDGGSQTATQSRVAQTVTQNNVSVVNGDVISITFGANTATPSGGAYYGYPVGPPSLTITANTGVSISDYSNSDSFTDSPTSYGTDTGVGGEVRGNYATWNPLDKNSNGSLLNGNLDNSNSSANNAGVRSTFALPSSEKWYAELRVNTNTSGSVALGFGFATASADLAGSVDGANKYDIYGSSSGSIFSNTSTVTSSLGAFTAGDILQIAYDGATGKAWLGKNNTWYNSTGGTTGNPAAGTNQTFTFTTQMFLYSYYYNVSGSLNCGQRAFAYTAPSGFKALCTQNLSTPTIGATATTQANKYFDVQTYTGNGTNARVITTNLNEVGLAWVKIRSGVDDHRLANVLTGGNKHLKSNNTDAESTGTTVIQAFSGSTFTIGTDNSVNVNGSTYVAWAWNAGGSNATNTSGTITSTVRANTTSGFSIVTYTGTGSNATVGHGLGVAPSMVIVKIRSTTGYWTVQHSALGSGYYGYLNFTNSFDTANANLRWNGTNPSSTVFSIGTASDVNTSSATYVAYCFAPVAGYSAFGSYTGNGSTDGTFVYTGFRPKYVLVKSFNNAENWAISDTSRSPYNAANAFLRPDESSAETTGAMLMDFLSNGFKLRTTDTKSNGSGYSYIYAAFAESPFKYSLAR